MRHPFSTNPHPSLPARPPARQLAHSRIHTTRTCPHPRTRPRPQPLRAARRRRLRGTLPSESSSKFEGQRRVRVPLDSTGRSPDGGGSPHGAAVRQNRRPEGCSNRESHKSRGAKKSPNRAESARFHGRPDPPLSRLQLPRPDPQGGGPSGRTRCAWRRVCHPRGAGRAG